jgi:DNA-binding MarR family transcriptional regulator
MAPSDDPTPEIFALARRNSTATVLFHHALADRLGLGPTDHKCLDLLHERGPMTGSQLAALTGLTSGAITGVTARLERAGLIFREPHPTDRRMQVLAPTPQAVRTVQEVLAGLPGDREELLDGFTPDQLDAVREYLARSVDYLYRRAAALRADSLALPGSVASPKG